MYALITFFLKAYYRVEVFMVQLLRFWHCWSKFVVNCCVASNNPENATICKSQVLGVISSALIRHVHHALFIMAVNAKELLLFTSAHADYISVGQRGIRKRDC